MDYEKKYKEAIEYAHYLINERCKEGTDDSFHRADLQKMFPELAESESERIRKAIKYGLDHVFTNNTTVFEVTKEQCLSWLEKQGEQKPTDKVEPKFKVGDLIKLSKEPKYTAREIISIKNDGYYFDSAVYLPFKRQDDWELVGQKPTEKTTWYDNMDDLIADAMIDDIKNADMPEHCKHNRLTWINKHRSKSTEWSEEDDYTLKGIIDEIEANKNTAANYEAKTYDRFLSFLKSLKERVQPQPQKWSEEDEEQLSAAINIVVNSGHTCTSDWLKSLRPQSHWKPSKEQMEELQKVINKGWFNPHVINGLYQDLKAL